MCCFLYRKIDFIKHIVHIGKLLQAAVKKTGLNIDVIAKKAGYKRGTYYLHIKQKNLNAGILKKYARAIGYDFSSELPEIMSSAFGEEDHVYKKQPLTLDEAIKQRDEWKEKYYALMEKYLKYVEQDNKAE